MQALVDRLDALLPQTQCRQCNFPGCRPYAEAIINGEVEINQCPPGGATGIRALADLLGRKPIPLNPENGVEKPRTVVFIDEERCIGCTLCIQACPVDAIVGASKLMHMVIELHCTGCDLCLPPCPVDCIEIIEATTNRLLELALQPPGAAAEHRQQTAALSRRRFEARNARLLREKQQHAEKMGRHKQKLQSKFDQQERIRAAIQRAASKRLGS